MNNLNARFVAMPSLGNLSEYKIKYQDALTYLSLRSYNNNSTETCFPSYETIATRAGTSRGFIIKSIERLEASELISVKHSTVKDVSNRYKFAKINCFEQIPYEFFDVADLTLYEKAMLLCLRQFFNLGFLCSIYSIRNFSELLGVSYNTLSPIYNSLKAKEYVKTEKKIYRGKILSSTDHLTPKISWLYDYKKKATVEPKVKNLKIIIT